MERERDLVLVVKRNLVLGAEGPGGAQREASWEL